MIAFEVHQVFVGQLRTANDSIPNVRCEVFLNRVDTTLLKAEVYDVNGTIAGRFLRSFIGRNATFEAEGLGGKIRFNGIVMGGQLASASDRVGTISIAEYEETWYANVEPITKVSFIYYLTPIQIFKRRRFVVQDDMKGLLLGWRGGLNPGDNSWDDESVVFHTSVGDVEFCPGLVFANEPGGDVIIREQLKAVVRLTGDPVDINGQKIEIDEIIGRLLKVVSFLEQRRCKWFRVEIEARGKSDQIFTSTLYQRLARYDYSESQHIDTYFKSYAESIPIIAEKWTSLDESVRLNLDKAISQMLYGVGADQSVENQLVYWHSCLDILIKAISGPKMRDRKSEGFSRNLILACEDVGICWNDLYPYTSRERVFSDERMDFLITQYRNRIIHEGSYPEAGEYQELIVENARARALMERLVMGVLGLYNKDSPVGKYRIF